MWTPVRPIASTSAPSPSGNGQPPGPKTYVGADFSNDEDDLPRWRGVALFGMMGVVEGILLWMNVIGLPRGATPLFPPEFAAVAALAILAGLVAAFVGLAAESVACFGAAALWIFLSIASSVGGTPGNPPTVATDLAVYLGVVAAGAFLAGVGLIGSVMLRRAIAHELNRVPASAV